MAPIETIDYGFHAFFMSLRSESYEAAKLVRPRSGIVNKKDCTFDKG